MIGANRSVSVPFKSVQGGLTPYDQLPGAAKVALMGVASPLALASGVTGLAGGVVLGMAGTMTFAVAKAVEKIANPQSKTAKIAESVQAAGGVLVLAGLALPFGAVYGTLHGVAWLAGRRHEPGQHYIEGLT